MTTLSEAQIALLQQPLDRKHVTQRNQSGRSLSYVEGWHVIAEANRIFGFDGWDRETVELREVRPPELVRNSSGKETWRVGFMARVRVTVGRTIREGTGFGSGALGDMGEAYESAIKEAETDAMKRALMTFGNPFGLALYDKTQANVANHVEEAPKRKNDGYRSDGTKTSFALKKEKSWEEVEGELNEDLADCHSLVALESIKVIYRKKAKEKDWNKDYNAALAERFEQEEEAIRAQIAKEDDFPGDRPSADLKNNGYYKAMAAG